MICVWQIMAYRADFNFNTRPVQIKLGLHALKLYVVAKIQAQSLELLIAATPGGTPLVFGVASVCADYDDPHVIPV